MCQGNLGTRQDAGPEILLDLAMTVGTALSPKGLGSEEVQADQVVLSIARGAKHLLKLKERLAGRLVAPVMEQRYDRRVLLSVGPAGSTTKSMSIEPTCANPTLNALEEKAPLANAPPLPNCSRTDTVPTHR